jgi:hypothetical protein
MIGNVFLGLVVFILILFMIYNKKEFKDQYEELMKHSVDIVNGNDNFKESNYKRYVNAGVSITKRKIDNPVLKALDDKLSQGIFGFDYITYRLLEAKKERLIELEGNHSLLINILKRDYDKESLNQALAFKGCQYDKEMELFNSLILRDSDPLLFIPFYNEYILREMIMDRMDEIYREEAIATKDLFKAKNKVIERIKDEYKDEDKNFINQILDDTIDFNE